MKAHPQCSRMGCVVIDMRLLEPFKDFKEMTHIDRTIYGWV
jgi:hypothetical protein